MSITTLKPVRPLTALLCTKRDCKAEMIDFYKTFIDPTSPTRAKLVVRLIAQGASSKAGVEKANDKKDEVTLPISNGTQPLLITSVRDYKARMAVTAGPRAVHSLKESNNRQLPSRDA